MITRNGIVFLVLLFSLLSILPHEILVENIVSWQKDGFRDPVTFFKSHPV